MPSYASTDNQQAFRCPRCDGSGKVKLGKNDQEREVDCSICGGSGRVTAARMAGYQGTPDAIQRDVKDETSEPAAATPSNRESSNTSLLDLLDDRDSQSSAVEDILKSSSELPSNWTDDEFQELMQQKLAVCPRCSGMKQVFLKGKRSFCPICRGVGVTTSQRAQEWRQEAEGENDDRFTPRA